MNEQRKLSLTNKIKELGPKLKWMLFSEMQDLKIGSQYLDFIAPDTEKQTSNATEKLEAMVRETLIKEFSPEIQNSKSFELLVDSICHNIKKKQLQEEEE